jgi:hypothetical protein
MSIQRREWSNSFSVLVSPSVAHSKSQSAKLVTSRLNYSTVISKVYSTEYGWDMGDTILPLQASFARELAQDSGDCCPLWPSAGLLSFQQRETRRLVSFWSRLVGVGVAGGKRPAGVCGGRGQAQAPTFVFSYDQQTGFRLPLRVTAVWVCPELRCSVIVSVDVTLLT